jgi:hypothetical protein
MTEATIVYSGRMTNWPLIGVGVAAFVALIILGRPWAGPWPGMLVLLTIALVLGIACLVTSTSLRVTTGPRGVDVRCGAIGWPRFSYPRARIAAVDVVTVSPWKSWNYGLVWTPSGGWSFVLRSGPALRLTLTNGRPVTVGVNDPQAAMTALGFASPAARSAS